MAAEERRRPKATGAAASGGLVYDGELASSILLDESDGGPVDIPATTTLMKQPLYSFEGGGSQPACGGSGPLFAGSGLMGGSAGGGASSSGRHSARQLAPHQRADGEGSNRTPTRTPSPVYQWNHPKDRFHVAEGGLQNDSWGSSESQQASAGGGGCEAVESEAHAPAQGRSSSSTSGAGRGEPQGGYPPQMPFPFFPPPYWSGAFNPQAQAYFGMMMGNNPLGGTQAAAAAAAAASGSAQGEGGGAGMDPNVWQMMVAMQVMAAQGGPGMPAGATAEQTSHASASSASPPPHGGMVGAAGGEPEELQVPAPSERLTLRTRGGVSGAPSGGPPQRDGGAVRLQDAEGKRTKSRNKDKEAPVGRQVQELAANSLVSAVAPRERGPGGKGERRRRGGGPAPSVGGDGDERPAGGGGKSRPEGGGGKSRPLDMRSQSSNPMIEQLKQRDRNVELSDLAAHISEIAQDQYGSRLIQQKLEVANEEEKQIAFVSVLQKMPQLTTDVFGNYVIQKFFEYGNAEQRRILAEQLVGQVLKLSLQMYGCRVVQKALDSVPIDQQVLLIGELKGNVLKCIEDQHGNHVIQKCIERLPTDRIGFIVESFIGQTSRMAKHCYGCRVIQRLIEYCASAQISPLLEEVLRCSTELATDQYGNYVVQHVMEHSSRPGDRAAIMHIVRKNILSLSCHKYASNVIEKALACGTMEERALLIYAIVGEQGDAHPPLLTMMRDRFGNYIVQRVIALAQGPQRDALLWKLHEHMPVLKKSNTYGKHIISALERAQAHSKD